MWTDHDAVKIWHIPIQNKGGLNSLIGLDSPRLDWADQRKYKRKVSVSGPLFFGRGIGFRDHGIDHVQRGRAQVLSKRHRPTICDGR